MEINYNIISLIDFLGLVQGVFLGIVLIFESRFIKSKLFLGLFLIAYSIELFSVILEDLNILTQKPSLLFFPGDFYYLIIPLFYLYVKSISNTVTSKKTKFIILLPGILEFVFYSVLFLQKSNLKLSLANSESFNFWLYLLTVMSIPYTVYYCILTIKHVNNHKKKVENFYSNTQGKLLNWAKRVIVFLLIYYSLSLVFVFFAKTYFESYTYPIISTINLIFIFWVGICGIRQSKVFINNNYLKTRKEESNVVLKENKTTLNESSEFLKLTKLVREEKLFLEPNISLADVSKKINISQRNLSALIKEQSNKNFNQFINYYRVEEAKKLLLDASNNNLNMLGIAFDSGFSSKASFYSVFKKTTSLTPKSFKNKNLK